MPSAKYFRKTLQIFPVWVAPGTLRRKQKIILYLSKNGSPNKESPVRLRQKKHRFFDLLY